MARRKKTVERAEQIRTEFVHDPLRDFQGSPAELFVARVGLFLRENSRAVLGGLAALFVAVAGFVLFTIWSDAREEESVVAFEKLLREPSMAAESGAETINLEKLDKYAQAYGTANGLRRADLQRLQFLYSQKKYAEAGDVASRLAEDLSTPELRAYFYLRAGFYYENAAKYAPAQNAFQKSADLLREDNLLKATAMFGLGRTLISVGQKDEGRKALEAVLALRDPALDEVRRAALAFLLTVK